MNTDLPKFNKHPKDESQLLAKMCLDVAQQGETKYDGKTQQTSK